MKWTLESIEANLLGTSSEVVAYGPDVIVAAVNRVEEFLGTGWIQQETFGAKGLAVGVPIIQIGIELELLKGVKRPSELITKIRSNTQNARTELAAIHLLRSQQPSAEVELYPPVGNRKADFRIRLSGAPWTTVEVTNPSDSEALRNLRRMAGDLAQKLATVDHSFSLEVLLTREPSQNELRVLSVRLPEFCRMNSVQHAILNNELGYLFLNDIEVGQVMGHDLPGTRPAPLIGVMLLVGGLGGRPVRQISVRIPFTDQRAATILKNEARQLPKGGIGVVMIEVSNAPGSLNAWVPLLKRRFGPALNTRISGVSLFKRTMGHSDGRYSIETESSLIANPYAAQKLPQWIEAALAN